MRRPRHTEDPAERGGEKGAGGVLPPVALALLLGSCVLALCLISGRLYEKRLLRQARERAAAAVTPNAGALSRAINRRIVLVEGLRAFVEATPSEAELRSEFPVFAAGLHAGARDVRNVAFAPRGVMRLIYPLAGNESALGHDLFLDPVTREDAQRALRSRAVTVSAPYLLRQGGLGLVARQAVFSGREFRGFASVVVNLPAVFEEARLAVPSPYLLALRDRNGGVFYGERRVFQRAPVILPVELPEGRWELAAVPREGWGKSVAGEELLFVALCVVGACGVAWTVYRAVTVRKRLEAAVEARTVELRHSTEYNRALFQNSAIGLALCRLDGTVVDINPAFAAILGRSVEEALGVTYWDLTPERYRQDEKRQLEMLERTGRYGPYEKEYRRKDGTLVPVRLQGCLLEHGGERFIWSSVEDISERTALEGRLRERNEQLSVFVEHAPAAIAMFDCDMRYLLASRRWMTDFKLHGEVIGRSHYEMFPHLPEHYKAVHRRCLDGATESSEGERFQHPDGSASWIRWAVHPWYSGSGEIGGIIIFSEDITERKNAEMELAREHRFSEALIDSLPGVLYLYDDTLKFIRWNRRFEEVTGYSGEEVAALSPLDFFRGPDRDLVHRRIEEVFARGDSCVEAAFVGKEESATAYFFTGRRLEIDDRTCLLGVGIDISQRKRLEEELTALNQTLETRVEVRTQELNESRLALINLVEDLNEKTAELSAANEKLKEMDRLKSLFIASMSHELRTPLNSIIGYTSVMLKEWVGPVSAEQKNLLSIVLRAGRHLLALINDIIDVSKVEAGQLEVKPEEFDLHDLLTEAYQQLEGEAAAKGVPVTVENLHRAMRTDRRRLLQVILNLMGNAVKYTEKGGIRVAAREEGDVVEIAVSDTGIGIAEEELQSIFAPFVRLESPLRHTVPGTGLGLYLTRKLMEEVLQGTVSCSSTVGKGSTFTVRLPAAPAEMPRQEAS